jgi:hypothetical protein
MRPSPFWTSAFREELHVVAIETHHGGAGFTGLGAAGSTSLLERTTVTLVAI